MTDVRTPAAARVCDDANTFPVCVRRVCVTLQKRTRLPPSFHGNGAL